MIFPTQKYLTFTLKDFAYTASKHSTYNPRGKSYQTILETLTDTETTVLDDIDIYDLESGARASKYYTENLLSNKYNLKPRSLAKSIHIYINQLAFQYHIHAFKNLDHDLTDSQARSCAIRFYIENYAPINTRLATLTEEALRATPYAPIYFPEN